jgi:hypothetical protein
LTAPHSTRLVRAAAVGCLLLVVSSCGLLNVARPTASVTVFGRNAAPDTAWFAIVPMTDPPQTVGFGADIGVGCLEAPLGSQLVMLDDPLPEGDVAHALMEIGPEADPGGRSIWVDVAADGTLTTGEGTPGWWTDDPQPC